jgi:hypothetical protein
MNAPQDDEVTEKFAEKIVGLLDQSTREIDGITATKLEAARKEALAHFREKPVHAWAPQLSGTGRGGLGRFAEPFGFGHGLRGGVALLAVLACLAVVVAWQTFAPQQSSEIAEIDEALLTDELPINAFLDKGFDAWLKRPSH